MCSAVNYVKIYEIDKLVIKRYMLLCDHHNQLISAKQKCIHINKHMHIPIASSYCLEDLGFELL